MYVKFDMPVKYPSGDVEDVGEHMSTGLLGVLLGFGVLIIRRCAKYISLGNFEILQSVGLFSV